MSDFWYFFLSVEEVILLWLMHNTMPINTQMILVWWFVLWFKISQLFIRHALEKAFKSAKKTWQFYILRDKDSDYILLPLLFISFLNFLIFMTNFLFLTARSSSRILLPLLSLLSSSLKGSFYLSTTSLPHHFEEHSQLPRRPPFQTKSLAKISPPVFYFWEDSTKMRCNFPKILWFIHYNEWTKHIKILEEETSRWFLLDTNGLQGLKVEIEQLGINVVWTSLEPKIIYQAYKTLLN